MARFVRPNVANMKKLTFGVGQLMDPLNNGIIVRLVRNTTFFKYNCYSTKLKQSGYFK